MTARLVPFVALLAACNDGSIDLERMIDQRRYAAYQESEFFEDGRAMRTPPPETVPRTRVTNNRALSEGLEGGAYVDRIPIAVTRELANRGHDRFDTFCSPCHGILADGDSMVAVNMEQRRPPSLVGSNARTFPAGRIFQVITRGYGLMRPYTEELSIEERWATVAYLRALQVRSGVSLDALPVALRDRAERALR